MWRHFGSTLIGSILILGGPLASVHASISVYVTGVPSTYTPGSSLTFDVGLSGAADLNSYNVGLDLTSNKGTAGTDFYFVGSTTTVQAPAGSYVFSSSLSVSPFGFVATADKIPSTNTAVLNLSDFLTSGGTVADASPYTAIAAVVLKTTPAAGNLTLSFDGSNLELFDAHGNAVPGTISISNPPTIVAQGLATVPEPTSFVVFGTLFAIAGATVAWRRRRPAAVAL